MSSAKAILQSAIIYVVTNALAAAVPLLLLPILTRVLLPEDYGMVAMFAVVVQMLGALTGLSVHGAVGMRFFDRGEIDFPRYVVSCLLILAVSGTIVFFAVFFLANWLVEFTKLPLEWLLIAVLTSAAGFVVQIQLSIWQSARKPWRFGLLRLTQATLDLGLSLLLVLGLAMAWQGRVGASVLAVVVCACIAFVTLMRSGYVSFPARVAYARNALRFGIPLIPHTVGSLLVASVDRFIIINVLDVGSAGIYLVAVQIGLVMSMGTDAFNRAFAPWLIQSLKTPSPKRDRIVVRATYLGFVLLLTVGLVIGLLAPSVLSIVVGPKYQTAAGVVVYIALGQAFGGMYLLVTNYVFYAGRTGYLAAVSITAGILNIGASYLLLKTNGLAGAGQAFLFAQMILFAGTFFVAQRVHPMPWLATLVSWRQSDIRLLTPGKGE